MGTTVNQSSVRPLLARLTPREMEVCVLHFADGQSQTTIAQWLHTNQCTIKRIVAAAVRKVPQLKPLQTKSRLKPKQPRTVHLSQIDNARDRERGPFNADEL